MTGTKKTVRAADLMRHEVVTLGVDDLVEQAVAVLEDHGIGGAPVVDATGRLVGAFSVRDVARAEHFHEGRLESEKADASLPRWSEEELEDGLAPGDEPSYRDGYSPSSSQPRRVGDWMSATVVSVAPSAPVKAICRAMVGEGVHRVFVVEKERLIGVISSLDVVRWLAGSDA